MSYQRIARLSTEVVETLYLLGAEDQIAGISGFSVRPPRARKEKPKISGFSSARIDRILAVNPDLVVAFSDGPGWTIPFSLTGARCARRASSAWPQPEGTSAFGCMASLLALARGRPLPRARA